jgi:hypothetical protein
LLVAAGALCAASGAGSSTSPTAQTASAKRKLPLIDSRSLFVNRQFSWRARHMPAERLRFKHRFDEPRRTQRLTCVDQHQLGVILGFDLDPSFARDRNAIARVGLNSVHSNAAARDQVQVPLGIRINRN